MRKLSSVAILALAVVTAVSARQAARAAVAIDGDDIGGVVTGARGPEAGVWVIAETSELPTRYIKTVVTDDQGRYLLPDLPRAGFSVWVRGYGLVDSPKVQAQPGRTLNLTAVAAPDLRAAAQYYPANYWLAMLQVPAVSEFPGTGPQGNGINPNMRSQAQWIRLLKTDSCESCHQLGNTGTREIPASLGVFDSSAAAWDRRVQSGQAGGAMNNGLNNLGRPRALAMFGDWTDRIRNGELPSQTPPRPQGLERNIVITQWDWADPKAYLHDEIATDKRNPHVNAHGPLYGSLEASADYVPVLDPVRHTSSRIPLTVRDPNTSVASAQMVEYASAYWGNEPIWTSKANAHNPMLDHRGRVWLTSRVRNNETPAFCRDGSAHPSAKLTPVNNSGRQLAMYDPASRTITHVDTCFGTHHLFFAEDANHTLWTSSGGGGGVVGWLNTKLFDETGDEQRSQGWTALVLDLNGNGRRDAYVEADQPTDPAKDKRVNAAFYGVMPSPDGSVWGSVVGFPGMLVRLNPGANPPETALAEVYEVPWGSVKAPVLGYGPRGMDVDRNGVAWVVLASGHLASFDRRKCAGPLNGPTATGQHCPEGWRLYQTPGPNFKGAAESANVDSHYYDWVDQFDTFGLGQNTPIATGNGSDSLLALNPATGQFTTLRVPYPMGFFAKGLDGRIDDPRTGWKGKGLWTTWATRTPFHSEGGTSNQSKIVHFQLRPNPLAR
ncbi:MAG: carboxypeptidase regulatory-like domain-containing protein [Acidimicrobiia bacterium]|nr:carboxypeptidase regulatory-like domain-containing protein [Acidimicrobiia bacterium]